MVLLKFSAIGSILALTLLAGCDGAAVDYGTKQDVVIEGIPHIVYQMKSANGTWFARETDLKGGFIDPNDYRRNILAIEEISKCKVDISTVINQGLVTMAATTCQ